MTAIAITRMKDLHHLCSRFSTVDCLLMLGWQKTLLWFLRLSTNIQRSATLHSHHERTFALMCENPPWRQTSRLNLIDLK
jgi:hypothetical protein